MKLPYIAISTTSAATGLEHHRPPMQIKQRPADIHMRRSEDQLEISTKAAQLYIDQSEAFADAHLKRPLRSMNEFVAAAKQHVLMSIGHMAQEGRQLMAIETGTNAIP